MSAAVFFVALVGGLFALALATGERGRVGDAVTLLCFFAVACLALAQGATS